jgi:hypothetical protein
MLDSMLSGGSRPAQLERAGATSDQRVRERVCDAWRRDLRDRLSSELMMKPTGHLVRNIFVSWRYAKPVAYRWGRAVTERL